MIDPKWRIRIALAVSAVVAVWLGDSIAEMELFWPSLIAGILVLLAVNHFQPLPVGTLIIGGIIFGYIVGNRGFAQVSITERIPLLPAELALLVAGSALAVHSAVRRTTPVLKDPLNLTIIAWAALSSIRLYSDLHTFGVMALRDYATIYYSAFFFLVQSAGGVGIERRYLERSLYAGFVLLLLIFPLYMAFPDYFLEHFLFRGVPLIFYKGDLLGTFLAAGALIAYVRYESNRSPWTLCLCLIMVGETMSSNNRASMVGLIVPAIALAAAGRRRLLAILGGSAVAAIVVLFLVAQFRGQPWEETPLHSMYERVVSLSDPLGEKNYSGEETSYKGDNNAFRTVWWRSVIDETVRVNPWYGMGWGDDLAEPFTRVYYPEGGEDFSARSPHNILVTIFARTGLLGLVPFLAFLAAFAVRFWRALKSHDRNTGLWCASATILTSSCFGIVLEGPMGAVLFWSLLGLACSSANDDPSIAGVAGKDGMAESKPDFQPEMALSVRSQP